MVEELKACVDAVEKVSPVEALPFVVLQVVVVVFAFAKKSLPQFVKEIPSFIAKVLKK